MNISRKILAVALGTAAVTTVTTLGTAAPAQAGGCVGGMCGGVTSSGWSVTTLPVTDNWTTSPSTSQTLSPGQSRGGWWSGVDVDGFRIWSGCYGLVTGFEEGGTVRVGAGWHKVSTNEQVTVNVQCP